MVDIGASLFDRLDVIDLGRLRRACAALPGSTPQLMAAALVAFCGARKWQGQLSYAQPPVAVCYEPSRNAFLQPAVDASNLGGSNGQKYL